MSEPVNGQTTEVQSGTTPSFYETVLGKAPDTQETDNNATDNLSTKADPNNHIISFYATFFYQKHYQDAGYSVNTGTRLPDTLNFGEHLVSGFVELSPDQYADEELIIKLIKKQIRTDYKDKVIERISVVNFVDNDQFRRIFIDNTYNDGK